MCKSCLAWPIHGCGKGPIERVQGVWSLRKNGRDLEVGRDNTLKMIRLLA